MNNIVTINSRKFDGSIHRSWKGELLEDTPDYWLFAGKFEREIIHPQLGQIKKGTISYEYYWKNSWFSVFRFHEPDGQLRNYYCNINLPPSLANNVLDYIDLDVDILVWDDFTVEILDQAEFKENSVKYSYTKEMIVEVENNISDILFLIENHSFPFDKL